MADVSRVEYNDEPLIDLTNDTVTPMSLRSGVTAHNAAGDPITGVGGAITVIDDDAGRGDWDKVWSADKAWRSIDEVRELATGGIHNEGSWNSANSYEKYAAVTANGNSYMALDNVPVGVDIHNNDYWLKLAEAGGPVNIDDLAGEGDTNVTWSANKIDVETYNIKEKILLNHKKYVFGNKEIIAYPIEENFVKINNYYNKPVIDITSSHTSHKVIQGACYNSNADKVILAFRSNTDNGEVYLKEVSIDLKTVYGTYGPLQLGHANGLDYIPNKDVIICACGNSGTNSKKIVSLKRNVVNDTVSYTIENVYNTHDDVQPWAIAYDSSNDVIYYTDFHTIVITDTNLNKISSIPISIDVPNFVYDDTQYTTQGSFTYNGSYYIIGSSSKKSILISFDFSNGNMYQVMSFPTIMASTEAEDGFSINNKIYIISGQTFISVTELKEFSNNTRQYINTRNGVSSGDDLNDYTIPGEYTITNGDIMSSLINKPRVPNSGGTLFVSQLGYDHLIQMVISNATSTLGCTRKYYNGAWSAWKMLYNGFSVGDTISFTGMYVNGTLTSGIKEINIIIPLGVPVDSNYISGASNITYSGKLSVRQNGYLLGSSSGGADLNDDTVFSDVAFSIVGNALRCKFTTVSALSGQNNSSVACALSLTLTTS